MYHTHLLSCSVFLFLWHQRLPCFLFAWCSAYIFVCHLKTCPLEPLNTQTWYIFCWFRTCRHLLVLSCFRLLGSNHVGPALPRDFLSPSSFRPQVFTFLVHSHVVVEHVFHNFLRMDAQETKIFRLCMIGRVMTSRGVRMLVPGTREIRYRTCGKGLYSCGQGVQMGRFSWTVHVGPV